MVARKTSSAVPRPIPRPIPIPMPTLAKPLDPEEAGLARASDEVDWFEDGDPVLDAEAAEVDSPFIDDLVIDPSSEDDDAVLDVEAASVDIP